MAANMVPSWHENSPSRAHAADRHVVRLKQCTTASVVSRMLNKEKQFTILNQLKSQPVENIAGPKLTASRLKEISWELSSRRSRVIELSHCGAETMLKPERIREENPIHSPRIRIEGQVNPIHRYSRVTARRHFRIDAVEPRLESSLDLFRNSIDFVKTTVDEVLVTDVETAKNNAGNY